MNNNYLRVPLAGYEGLYDIDTNGDIFSLDRIVVKKNRVQQSIIGKKRKVSNHCTGYLTIRIMDKTHRVHRLVALTFLGNPPEGKESVNHKNGNKKDNRLDNLEWCSNKENTEHAIATGLMNQKGINNQSAKLSKADIKEALILVKEGVSIQDIAKIFMVSRNTIPKALDREFGTSWRECQKPQYYKHRQLIKDNAVYY